MSPKSEAAATTEERGSELVSVIMPMFNAARSVADQLRALAEQRTRRPYELIVVDNGSTDSSAERVDSFESPSLTVRLVAAPATRGPGFARNRGVMEAAGDILLFCDADDVVGPSWIDAHVDALKTAHAAFGPIREFTDPDPPNSFHEPWERRDLNLVAPYRLLPSGNMSIRRAVFEALGGFSTEPKLSEDMEFSVRLQEAGFTVGYAPDAKLYWRRPSNARQEFSKQRRYVLRSRTTLKSLKDPSIVGERTSPVWRKSAWLASHLPGALWSASRLRVWCGVAGKLAGQVEWNVSKLRRRGVGD
jgi:glycosyltransferase involved in cell wall biosynthesis